MCPESGKPIGLWRWLMWSENRYVRDVYSGRRYRCRCGRFLMLDQFFTAGQLVVKRVVPGHPQRGS